MPCRDYEGNGNDFTHRDTRERDKLAALLCVACNLFLDNGDDLPAELESWYKKHREADLNNMDDLISFASDNAAILTKSDFDALDKVLTDLRNKYS